MYIYYRAQILKFNFQKQKLKSYFSSANILSDTARRGTLSEKPKILLKSCKNQSRKTTARSQQISPIRPRPCAEASCERQKAPRPTEALSPRPSRRDPLAEAPPRKALDGMPILRFARGWARQTTSLPPSRPNSSDKMSRPG